MTRPSSPLWTPSRSLAPAVSSPFTRRSLLRGMMAGGALAAIPGLAGCGGDDSSGATGGGTATSLGSNFSDEVPQQALKDSIDAFIKKSGIKVDVNTVDHEQFQENITSYLQGGPQDVYAWFAGYRMKFFADQGFAGDVSDLWAGDMGDGFTDAFKQASTGNDGKQYFVPFYYYPWAVFYRKSLFEEKGYTIPETMDDLTALCQEMQKDGLEPIGFADKEGWPAMGTFDVLNFRQNGYDFHVSLMAGEESWESDEVKSVFETWRSLMPYHQKDALARDWLDSAAGLLNKKVGMYYLGMFVGQAFTKPEDRDDLDFFVFPALNEEHGTDTIEAPIDGWMMSPKPEDEKAAKQLLAWFGSGEGQDAYLKSDPNNVAASSDADTSGYNALQKKAAELVGASANITQFLDRDTRPDFASTVMIPSLQKFIGSPEDIDGLCSSIEEQKKSIFG
ncbi:ABC transporter substrate-binding protein [Nocardioides mesophilus]|uniref:Carbohydrate ABC transporter substrate-binding protein n=1 Tax=Nocardioides mesophilus TaxID=433659 RepID=A0A7G9RDF3_9ACTN|nr:ABC transporter substrate-binding protein [Nocardioides mesophilus]QNN53628.1 carbohydrate ABC transporter substrate-binding protein [Nocardioides mesophilus]